MVHANLPAIAQWLSHPTVIRRADPKTETARPAVRADNASGTGRESEDSSSRASSENSVKEGVVKESRPLRWVYRDGANVWV